MTNIQNSVISPSWASLRGNWVHVRNTPFAAGIFFLPVLYGTPIWNPYTKKLINLIENVQRRATEPIPGMSNLSYRERLEKMELPTLQYRRYREDMIEVYKLSHHFYDQKTSNNLLDFEQAHSHNIRGHPFKIFKLNCKKDVRKYYFNYRVSHDLL